MLSDDSIVVLREHHRIHRVAGFTNLKSVSENYSIEWPIIAAVNPVDGTFTPGGPFCYVGGTLQAISAGMTYKF